jgi:hypothetical protein
VSEAGVVDEAVKSAEDWFCAAAQAPDKTRQTAIATERSIPHHFPRFLHISCQTKQKSKRNFTILSSQAGTLIRVERAFTPNQHTVIASGIERSRIIVSVLVQLFDWPTPPFGATDSLPQSAFLMKPASTPLVPGRNQLRRLGWLPHSGLDFIACTAECHCRLQTDSFARSSISTDFIFFSLFSFGCAHRGFDFRALAPPTQITPGSFLMIPYLSSICHPERPVCHPERRSRWLCERLRSRRPPIP